MLLALLAAAAALRVILALRGGEYFWTDEARYVVSKTAASDFVHGQLRAGLDHLFSSADHLLFKVIGVIPALAQLCWGDSPVIAAVFFGSFSVGLIYLTWCLALSRRASTSEALFAAYLVAATNLFFYYARHLFPYDLALCLFAGAALLGFRRGSRNHFGAGLLAGLGFLTYNGYWLFGGTVLGLTVLEDRRALGSRAKQAAFCLLGLFLPILVVLGVGHALGHDLLRSFVEFSHTVNGDRGNAWRMIPAYFWASEHGLSLLWGFALITAFGAWLAGMLERAARTWLLGSLLFAVGIVGLSDVVQRFSVYGRHSRPLALFLCLLGGWTLERVYRSGRMGRILAFALAAAVAGQAAFNFRAPLEQEFPPQFSARAAPVIAADLQANGGFYRVLVDGLLASDADKAVRQHPHFVLLQSPHPYQFQPYAFDGFNEAIRADFRRADLSMQAVRLLAEAPGGRDQISRFGGPRGKPLGPVRLELIFDSTEPTVPVPLISSGVAGAGDQVFAQFTSPNTIRLGYDHWGNPTVFSRVFPCDKRFPHTLVVSYGALVPPAESGRAEEAQARQILRHWVFVTLDGQTAIKLATETFPAEPASVSILHNFIGLSSAAQDFSGRFLSVSWASPVELVKSLGFDLSPSTGPWAPYPGPLRMRLYFSSAPPGVGAPLISSGSTGAGDQLFSVFPSPGRVRIGFDHWGREALLSRECPCDTTKPHTLVISYGALYPADGAALFRVHPEWEPLKRRVFVSLDGRTVLAANQKSYESSPESIVYFHNFIGFSSSERDFTGSFISLESAPTEAILLDR